MKLYFYRGASANFGDELNHWLLPKVFPDFFDEDDSTLFLGIGSILFDHYPADCKKIVFGSGYGGYTPPPKLDAGWNIYCVRGPRTADALGLSRDTVAGDAAILINRYRKRPAQTTRRIGFMPHWQSLQRGNWRQACAMAGLHFIDPCGPVEQVLAEIESCASLIAEAMHGAIVADALRVPWVAALPIHAAHRFKWFDWAEALDMTLAPCPLWPSTAREAFMAATQRTYHRLEHPGKAAFALRRADSIFTALASARLWQLARREPRLSSDAALALALDRLEGHAARIRGDFSG